MESEDQPVISPRDLDTLRAALGRRSLTLYLGAGVSVASQIPDWRRLVTTMYYRAASDHNQNEGWRFYPNYLYAVADWHLRRQPDAPEILAQKVRAFYPDDTAFLQCLRETLYGPFLNPETGQFVTPDAARLRVDNKTLAAVARLCEEVRQPPRGVRAVLTYNFDDLLETVLKPTGVRYQTIATAKTKRANRVLPIYHVHGYAPMQLENGLAGSDLVADMVFSEEQYHAATHQAYSWSNLTQIKYLTQTVGLMVGLSLTDRNMRRLLDAIHRTPLNLRLFALLQRPQWTQPTGIELEGIHEAAVDYQNRFPGGGYKRREGRFDMIESLVHRVEDFDLKQQELLLKGLGVTPIWYDQHSEVPDLLDSMRA